MGVDGTLREANRQMGRTAGEGLSCPVCGGTLIQLRGACRCLRCQQMLCVGCEPSYEVEPDHEAD